MEILTLGVGTPSSVTSLLLVGLLSTGPVVSTPNAVGSFVKQAGTGAQAVTGVGFTPKAVLLFGVNHTSRDFTDGLESTFGLTDGAFSVSLTALSQDNAGTTDVHRAYAEGYVFLSISATGTVLSRAAHVSFDADGFTVTWDTNDGAATIINYVAFGGDDLEAKVGVFDTATSTGAQAVTGIGFRPTAVLCVGAWNTATSETSDFFTTSLQWMAMSAANASVIAGGACNVTSEDNAAAANTSRYQRTDKAMSGLRSGISGGVGTVYFDASPTSFDADGFTVTWTAADPTTIGRYYLALRGIEARCGVIVQPTTTGEQAVTCDGILPELVLAMSVGDVAQSPEVPVSESRLWFGAASMAAARGIWIGDVDAADPTVSARATTQDRLVLSATPNASGSVSATQTEASLAGVSSERFVLDWSNVDATPRQILFIAFGAAVEDPPSPGGEVPSGTNPAAQILPTGTKRLFFRLMLGGSPTVTYEFGETRAHVNITAEPRLVSVSEITREFSESVRGTEVTVVIADGETRQFRTLANTMSLRGLDAEILLWGDTERYANQDYYRLFLGRVKAHRPLGGWLYEFTLRDVLSEDLAVLADAPRIPPGNLTVSDFPGMEAQYEGRAIPLVLGACDDEQEPGNIVSQPQGVIPPVILGQVNFAEMWGGIDQDVIAAIWSQCALPANGIWKVYYNTPTDPYQRILIPESAYGSIVWTPGKTGWSETGLTNDYVLYPLPLSAVTRRWTPFFVAADHPYAQAYKNGQILVAGNIYGVSEDAEGGGLYLSDAPRIYQWLLTNFFYNTYLNGDYYALPTFTLGHAIVDTDTVEATVTRLRGFGGGFYDVGFMLGRGGQQQTLRHILEELCAGVDMQQGINRHGQIVLGVEDPDEVATVNLSDLHDIEDGQFETWADGENYRDTAEFVYGYRYVPPVAPIPTPAEGETLPATSLGDYTEWSSGLQRYTLSAAVTAHGGTASPPLHVENYVVRQSAVAADVIQRKIARLAGPAPGYDGQRLFRLTTSWQGLQKDGVDIELGTVIAIDHIEGYGASGYEGQRARVTKITVDAQRARVMLEGNVLA